MTSEAEARQSLRAVGARCSRVAALAIVALVVSGIASPHSARAQEVAEGQTLPAQYVLLLDDSRSMRDAKSDPDRLAVFAARSMLALLEDKDEVSLYRLNRSIDRKPSDAAQASMDPPQRLGEVRQRLEDALANDKPFAEYGGDATPCSAAFKVIADGLNEAHKRAPNARQVLIYLTDGVCENGAGTADVFDGDGFLKRIDSAAQQRFLFYVLRFRGRGFTQGLTALADKTHGATFEVTSDATGILGPFARALSQAQGFDALEVTPQNPTIAAHSSARRIRLLAVAEGEGPPLEIGFGGAKPVLLGNPRTGSHRFEKQKSYRYVALDYTPDTSKHDVSVANAGAAWKLIAIPEYRLKVVTSVRTGLCSEGGRVAQSVEIGGAACVQIGLRNDAGLSVPTETFGGHVDLGVSYEAPGGRSSQRLPTLRAGSTLDGTLERPKLDAGDHVFRPYATVTFGGGSPFELHGEPFTLQATTARMNCSISEWKIGKVVPGDELSTSCTLSGNFPKSVGAFRAVRPAGFPACVHFSFGGFDEGESGKLQLVSGQQYRVAVRVDPLCALKSTKRDLQATLRVEAPALPTLEIPASATLDVEIKLPESLIIQADRGKPTPTPLVVGGNYKGEPRFLAVLAEPGDGWPEKSLHVGFAPAGAAAGAPPDDLVREGEVRATQGGAPGVPIWTRTMACCGEGSYRTTLTLRVPGAGGEATQIPVTVNVGGGSWWGCYGGRVVLATAVLVGLFLLWLLRNLYSNTHFIALWKRGASPRVTYLALPRLVSDNEIVCSPYPMVPGWGQRLKTWLSNGGLATAFGTRAYIEVMHIKRMQRDSGAGRLRCDLALVNFRSVRVRSDLANPERRLPREPALFIMASSRGDRPATFIRIGQNEKTMLLPLDGSEEFLVQQEAATESITPADDGASFNSIGCRSIITVMFTVT